MIKISVRNDQAGYSAPFSSGAFTTTQGITWTFAQTGFTCQNNIYDFNAHNYNAVYTDNGLILPKSISKQSYIIYK